MFSKFQLMSFFLKSLFLSFCGIILFWFYKDSYFLFSLPYLCFLINYVIYKQSILSFLLSSMPFLLSSELLSIYVGYLSLSVWTKLNFFSPPLFHFMFLTRPVEIKHISHLLLLIMLHIQLSLSSANSTVLTTL